MSQIRKAEKSELKGLTLDEWDHKNLENFIRMYNRLYPHGRIRKGPEGEVEFLNIVDHTAYMRKYIIEDTPVGLLKTAKKDNKPTVRVSLPPTFHALLSKAYPSLMTDRKQTEQFLKWFPIFDLTRR